MGEDGMNHSIPFVFNGVSFFLEPKQPQKIRKIRIHRSGMFAVEEISRRGNGATVAGQGPRHSTTPVRRDVPRGPGIMPGRPRRGH